MVTIDIDIDGTKALTPISNVIDVPGLDPFVTDEMVSRAEAMNEDAEWRSGC